MKLLSICIPTYKRPPTLRRCIESVVTQIKQFELQDQVEIYVANDASPDNTAEVLAEFVKVPFFRCVNRAANLGMSANIKSMLTEALETSSFQLIITDDDFLLDETLGELVDFLTRQQSSNPEVSVIWTPRYSYTDDNELHGVVCETFDVDQVILPSYRNAGRYMYNGFVLSGLIVKASKIDYSFWSEYQENAYFPVIFSGDIMLRYPAMYWHRSIVHHAVLNECHWDRWGQSDAEITLRLFIDYLNAYVVIGQRLPSLWQRLAFYLSAFPRAYQMTNSLLITSGGFFRLGASEAAALLSIDKVSYAQLKPPAGIMLSFMLIRVIVSCLVKATALRMLSLVAVNEGKRNQWAESYERLKQWMFNAKFIMRWTA
jgi:glycosyltransferase involved in cell wall biosynthesis